MKHQGDSDVSMTRVRRSQEEARAAYDRMSGFYDLLAGSSERRYVEAGLRQLEAQAGERILEIGFGTGHALVALARSVGSSGDVWGLDLSLGMASVARGKLERGGLHDDAALVCGDGARLPMRDASVDAVFMSFTLELFDTPRIPHVLGACRRVMRDGGRLCVVSLARRRAPSLSVRFYEWLHSRFPRFADCRPIPLAALLKQAEFRLTELERRSMWTLPVDVALAVKTEG
ncbi:MAG: class I SAM-dependent methyltransferase [Anaerolineae bacterium]